VTAPKPSSPKPSSSRGRRLAFNLSTGADTGGAAIREVEAFRAHAARTDLSPSERSEWEVRAMVAADLVYSIAQIEKYWEAADVIHLNHTLHGFTWYDKGRDRPIVLEHHGLHRGAFDIDFAGSIAAATELGAVQIGSTANLELFGPIVWAPIPYDLEALAAIRTQVLAKRRSASPASPTSPDILTIAHAPTNRAIKGTDAFIAALQSMQDVGLPVRALLIEKTTHKACLALKAEADVFVDQLILGYGCNAIEAWAMGIPVVGGITDPKWHKHMQARWGGAARMPLFEATEATLAKRLTQLLLSPDLREEYAQRGLEHVRKWHTQAYSVKQMSQIYATAPQVHPPKYSSPPTHLTHQERIKLLRANRAELHRQRGV
jgi:hypothetical protein